MRKITSLKYGMSTDTVINHRNFSDSVTFSSRLASVCYCSISFLALVRGMTNDLKRTSLHKQTQGWSQQDILFRFVDLSIRCRCTSTGRFFFLGIVLVRIPSSSLIFGISRRICNVATPRKIFHPNSMFSIDSIQFL